jgi:hypothetical protein
MKARETARWANMLGEFVILDSGYRVIFWGIGVAAVGKDWGMGQKLEDVIFPPCIPYPRYQPHFDVGTAGGQGLSLHHGKAQKQPPIFCCRRKRCTGENAARREVFFGGNCNASWGRERTIEVSWDQKFLSCCHVSRKPRTRKLLDFPFCGVLLGALDLDTWRKMEPVLSRPCPGGH